MPTTTGSPNASRPTSALPPVVNASVTLPSVTTNPRTTATKTAAELLSGNGTDDASRHARIAARKARIEATRQAKMKPEEIVDEAQRRKTKLETEKRDVGQSKEQIAISRKRLENVVSTGKEAVTNIRVAIEARETARRQDEDKKLDQWRQKRDEDRVKCEATSAQIDQQWEKANNMHFPYGLQDLIGKQRQECDTLIEAKNKLISDYVNELKNKDDEYVKELKRQTEEIDTLLQRMRSQYKAYQTTIRDELDQIEKSFMLERSEMIESNMREIQTLYEERRNRESRYLEERAERIEENVRQLENLRINDAEDYNMVKIKLETDVQVLEQQLQQMRATYQLNTEKLEYNFQVLKKRDDENTVMINQQKRKITRLTDVLNGLKAKFAKQEKSSQQEYVSLTEDYKRITEQLKELQKKYRHFQLTDNKKFQDVWEMNEEEVKELMRKVIQADRIIYEQQLGVPWVAPSLDPFQSVEGMGKHRKDVLKEEQLLAAAANKERPSLLVEPFLNSKKAASTSLLDKSHDTLNTDKQSEENAAQKKLSQSPEFGKTVKRIMELLCNEAGFLVEDKLNKLLNPLGGDEQVLMRLDAIFKALGVETFDDVERLAAYFLQTSQPAPTSETEPIAENEEAEEDLKHRLIHPNDVIKALRRFLEDTTAQRQSEIDNDLLQGIEPAVKEDSPDQETAPQQIGQDDTLGAHRAHWERMRNVVADKNFRVWNAVYNSMQKYHTVLSERWTLHLETQSIRQQNEELKALLRQYFTAPVNDDLQVPPTKVMLGQL